jgi:hypothetical protein
MKHLAKQHKASGASGRPRALDFVCLDCREDGACPWLLFSPPCAALMRWDDRLGPEGRARAFFSAPPPTIVFCANRLHSAQEVEETLVHELVHAYDVRLELVNA